MLVAALLALLPTLFAQPSRYSPIAQSSDAGLPACSSPTQELAQRSGFILCFDSSRKVPTWTAHILTPHRLTSTTPRPKHFRHDYQLASPSGFDVDYRNSGFSRGHLVPVSDLSDQAAIQDSFLLSNAVPQNQIANQSAWKKLENAIRNLAPTNKIVIVITGTLFDCPETASIGSHHVAVPCAIFKAVLADSGNQRIMYAAIIPNSSAATRSPADYAVSIDELERRSGLDFFSRLDPSEQQALESVVHPFRR